MKRIIKRILLLALLCLPINVFGASIGVSCPSSVTVGDSINCTVVGYHTTLAGLKASVNYSGMDYVNVNNLTGSNMFVVSNKELDGAFDTASTSKSLAKYTFKASAAGTAKINIVCQQLIDGTDFSSVSCTNASATIVVNNKKNSNTVTASTTPSVSKSNDATLKGIDISVGNIQFEKTKDVYDIEVDYSVETVEIKGIPTHSKASVKIDGDTKLKVGNNTLKLNVTAEDGKTKKTYTINIIRKEKVLSKNNKLKKLSVDNYDIDFKESKKDYALAISNEDSLTINVELDDEYAKYEILGNEKLIDGSVIKINIVAEDGSTNTYSINIKKEKNLTNSLKKCLVLSLLFNVLVVLVAVLIIVKSKGKK